MAINTNINIENSLSIADSEFVNTIQNKITLFGQIPYKIPDKMVVEVIKSSARYFYEYYSKAWRQRYYYILKSDLLEYLGEDNFSNCYITINPRIRIIKEIYETNVSGPVSISAAMYDTSKTGSQNEMYGSVVNNNLYILQAVVKTIEARTYDTIFSSRLPYDFSPMTHELMLKKIPKGNILLDTYADNDIQTLYNNTFFERHVIANVKKELKRLLAGHQFELPGGVTLSADEICSNTEDAEKVEDIIKASSGVGDIILKRR